MDRFRWHPEARLFGADGTERARGEVRVATFADRPGVQALASALAVAAGGHPFRIGAPDLGPPAPGPVPVFETLTSGSTGTPRRIRRTHASWIASFAINARLLGVGPGSIVAVPGRLGQSLALYGALEAMHLGATLHLLDGLRPDRMAIALGDRGAHLVYATPAQLRLILDTPAPAPAPELRLIVCGGAKLDPATRTALAARFPQAEVREFYGTSEASFITLADGLTPPHSVGSAYPGVEIDLRGPSGTQQVWVRSPYLFETYAADCAPARWQDGWLSTGEIGHWDGTHLVLSGRADRMVTVADQNVFPEQIEAFLLSQPGVTRAAALPRPDPRRGHVIEAAVQGGDEATILAAGRRALGPLAAPKRLHQIADWPLLPSGKTDLAALARRLG